MGKIQYSPSLFVFLGKKETRNIFESEGEFVNSPEGKYWRSKGNYKFAKLSEDESLGSHEVITKIGNFLSQNHQTEWKQSLQGTPPPSKYFYNAFQFIPTLTKKNPTQEHKFPCLTF